MYRKILFSSVVFLFIFSVNAQENIPNMTLKTISGKSIESSEVLNSQGFSIISFWATWCIPCINELDAINELYDSWFLFQN